MTEKQTSNTIKSALIFVILLVLGKALYEGEIVEAIALVVAIIYCWNAIVNGEPDEPDFGDLDDLKEEEED